MSVSWSNTRCKTTVAALKWKRSLSAINSQLMKDPQVLFAGYKVPHPLEHKIVIRVQTTPDYSPQVTRWQVESVHATGTLCIPGACSCRVVTLCCCFDRRRLQTPSLTWSANCLSWRNASESPSRTNRRGLSNTCLHWHLVAVLCVLHGLFL